MRVSSKHFKAILHTLKQFFDPWFADVASVTDYFIFQMFLLGMLDNLPRLWLSDVQMNAILFVMKHSSSQDVPSLKSL